LNSSYFLNDIQIDKKSHIGDGKSKPSKYVLKVSNKSHQSFEEYPVLFKKGDDLRKDHVMLQIIKLIQKVF
jgi:phosphatidylinositol kinase/protein kinase (PI-3  family)